MEAGGTYCQRSIHGELFEALGKAGTPAETHTIEHVSQNRKHKIVYHRLGGQQSEDKVELLDQTTLEELQRAIDTIDPKTIEER